MIQQFFRDDYLALHLALTARKQRAITRQQVPDRTTPRCAANGADSTHEVGRGGFSHDGGLTPVRIFLCLSSYSASVGPIDDRTATAGKDKVGRGGVGFSTLRSTLFLKCCALCV